mmetsp:Transcript_20092/g.43309  ORF Transcript_20092/g.43309 Transcript_20092/m.43309 type:complete len:1469 (+) Transcript_20092:333-4739(+)
MSDASFLSSTRADPTTSVAGEEAAAGAVTTARSATAELYRTNLLRLETTELLSESTLHLSPFSGELDREVKWSDDVRRYVETVRLAIESMDATALGPDTAAMPMAVSDDNQTAKKRYWVDLDSDKFRKHVSGSESARWCFPFPGGKGLQIEPIGQYGAGGAGMTNQRGNALCLPMVDVAVLVPSHANVEEEGMIGGKDYLNGRYFDKQNILAIHIAKLLSQKKHRKKIGTVHASIERSDLRRIALILTPPLPEDLSESNAGDEGRSKKRRKGNNDDLSRKDGKKKGKTKKKTRFRVRLVLGMQGNPVAGNFWFPRARIFPDRCNNRVGPSSDRNSPDQSPTPTYTNALARDLHHVSTARTVHAMSKACGAFNEALVLAKIWCLQRGFLRGHDTFDTTSLSVLLVYLYRTKKAGTRMGPIQVFTILMKFIAETDWLGEGDTIDAATATLGGDNEAGARTMGTGDTIRYAPSEGYQGLAVFSAGNGSLKAAIVLPELGLSEAKTIDHCAQGELYHSDLQKNGFDKSHPKTLLDCYKAHVSGPVFLDSTMTLNYFGSISPSFIRELQGEARKAIRSLHLHSDEPSGATSPFRQLLMEGCRFWRRYDAYIHIDLNNIRRYVGTSNVSAQKGAVYDMCAICGANDVGTYESISRSVIKVLRMALGDRVTAIRALTFGNGETDLMQGNNLMLETDQVPSIPIRGASMEEMKSWGVDGDPQSRPVQSPVADGINRRDTLVLGLRINPQTCHRIIDRGPQANDKEAMASFIALWGKEKAELRRFKDGAIVHAVLWNTDVSNTPQGYIKFSGDEKMGGVVERIIRHVINLHFVVPTRQEKSLLVAFGLRNMMSLIEGVSIASNSSSKTSGVDSTAMHKDIMAAFDSLTVFLRRNSIAVPVISGSKETRSKLGLPLAVEAVEPVSPSLRYSELFPPEAQPLLGDGKKKGGGSRVPGVTTGSPIVIQLRLEGNSKWPTDVKAISAAKCALLIQLAEGIETMKRNGSSECWAFNGPIHVTPTYIDLGYRGYSWRIMIRADQEIKLLSSLRKPSAEALELRTILTKRHVASVMHHSMIHSVHTQHPSAGSTVRLAMRWIHAHMLTGLLPQEAIEILVGKVVVDSQPLDPPATPISGFLRFLRLIASHDWVREPLIFDPQGRIGAEDYARINADFVALRGAGNHSGPPMFLITPDCLRSSEGQVIGVGGSVSQVEHVLPTFTRVNPELVVLSRVVALAKRTEQFLLRLLIKGEAIGPPGENLWASVFHESTASLKSYSVLLRVDPQFVVDPDCSSTGGNISVKGADVDLKTPFTRSIMRRSAGPKSLRRYTYKNVVSSADALLHGWRPIDNIVDSLRTKFGSSAIFFYNGMAPDIIAVLWRPTAFSPISFTAMHSKHKRPLEDDWQEDGLVACNSYDIVREVCNVANDAIQDVKILDERCVKVTRSSESKILAMKRKVREDQVNDAGSITSSGEGSNNEEDD